MRFGLNSFRSQIIRNEHVARYTGNMFFHQGVVVHQVVDRVRGKNMFQLQTANTRSVCHFDVEVIVYLVVVVHDLNSKWLGIAKYAKIDALNVQVFLSLRMAGMILTANKCA